MKGTVESIKQDGKRRRKKKKSQQPEDIIVGKTKSGGYGCYLYTIGPTSGTGSRNNGEGETGNPCPVMYV